MSGSEYPNGPYIGFPSYAQPIIGECEVISLKSPLFLIVKLFSKVLAISCEYPRTLNPNEFFLDVRLKSPNLSALFNFRGLTTAPRTPFDPLGIALISVVDALYPKPEFITTALIICPFSTIGLTIAPDPVPVSLISKSGVEKYPSP